jgi:hypothetical protein
MYHMCVYDRLSICVFYCMRTFVVFCLLVHCEAFTLELKGNCVVVSMQVILLAASMNCGKIFAKPQSFAITP